MQLLARKQETPKSWTISCSGVWLPCDGFCFSLSQVPEVKSPADQFVMEFCEMIFLPHPRIDLPAWWQLLKTDFSSLQNQVIITKQIIQIHI